MRNEAVLDNEAGATFTIENDPQIVSQGGNGGIAGINVFHNAGTLIKLGAAAPPP